MSAVAVALVGHRHDSRARELRDADRAVRAAVVGDHHLAVDAGCLAWRVRAF